MFDKFPDVVSVDELQEMLGIGKNTAYKLINDKKIKSVQIGRQHKIPKCYIIDFLMKDDDNAPVCDIMEASHSGLPSQGGIN